ncbi:MAG: PilZ domain-containing protein [Pyrinomonadaceae bacterium]|nr:PilZ domain-containing protein [Pyrinomonadaceae bacterium]MBP7416165.1 PilZ domain-containing protein [Pyrinomonadaceae bacterium]
MSINQRQHIRFSLDIPAIIYSKFGEKQLTRLQQISIGGCFTDWDDSVLIGDEFRMEIELPNKNYLPLHCKALYLFEHTGIGVRFVEITKFEQSLISKIIANKLENEGVPLQIDPFTLPPTFVGDDPSPRITDIRQKRDAVLQHIMSGGDAY